MTKTEQLTVPLGIDQVEFRIQSINRGGYATILAYKDARVDMHRLNDVFGVGGWQRRHELINGQLFCSVGIWNDEIKQWAWVTDVGTQSNTEKEKGQASDAFKRACFNLGIGIELYDYPEIKVQLKKNEWKLDNDKPKATWDLKVRDWVWFSQFTDGQMSYLAAKDKEGLRFQWGEFKQEQAA